jgi:catechol 2,3-dioxygenase-like lactoylglutathione lyase family enzyme
MFREIKTEAQMQRFLNFEGVLILMAIGADIFIEALKSQDWIAAAVIIGGFLVLGGLYWHSMHLDRLFDDLHASVRHLIHGRSAAIATPLVPVAIPLPASTSDRLQDVTVAMVADRPIVHVSNFPLSRNFYAAVLAPLGYSLTIEFPALSMASFGVGGASDLWIKGDGAEHKLRASFSAASKRIVDDFCEAALDAGGTIAETAGPRSAIGQDAYAAAVLDPDGYTIEAVFNGGIAA